MYIRKSKLRYLQSMYVFAIFRLAGSVQLRAGLNGGQFKTRPLHRELCVPQRELNKCSPCHSLKFCVFLLPLWSQVFSCYVSYDSTL